MQRKQKKTCWGETKKILNRFEKEQFISLIYDLYRLSSDNKNFFHTRFSIVDDPLFPYKSIIQDSLHPCLEENETIDFERANDAISQYLKAVDNPSSEAELRIYSVECGNDLTLDYGDIDGNFYDSLLEMYESAVETVLELPEKEQSPYKKRAYEIMKSAYDIGWGYYDGLCDVYHEAFPEDLSQNK